jgi:hypothetical protein
LYDCGVGAGEVFEQVGQIAALLQPLDIGHLLGFDPRPLTITMRAAGWSTRMRSNPSTTSCSKLRPTAVPPTPANSSGNPVPYPRRSRIASGSRNPPGSNGTRYGTDSNQRADQSRILGSPGPREELGEALGAREWLAQVVVAMDNQHRAPHLLAKRDRLVHCGWMPGRVLDAQERIGVGLQAPFDQVLVELRLVRLGEHVGRVELHPAAIVALPVVPVDLRPAFVTVQFVVERVLQEVRVFRRDRHSGCDCDEAKHPFRVDRSH